MSDVAHGARPPNGLANLAAGSVVAGRFRLESPLGTGGMAEVWRAQDLLNQRTVAVKLLRAQVASSNEAVARLKREGELLTALSHPAIVRVETYGQIEGGVVFLAMELLDGETLGARMRRGRMDPTELAPIVAGTCAGLGAAHAKMIVHRDLKPDNIFLLRSAPGVDPQVKLLDFGISKVYGGDRLTYTGEVLGTPRYMSPEQLGAEPDVDPRIDVYALGVIMYEALAGKPPFLAATATDLIVAILHGKIVPLRALRPDLPMAVEGVVMRAMARAREGRYARAIDLADAFLDAAGATARARALPKAKVLRTQALGGAGGASLPPELMIPGAPGSDADLLRPGTFSAFEQIDESAIRAAQHASSGGTTGQLGSASVSATATAPAPLLGASALAPPIVSPSAFGSPAPISVERAAHARSMPIAESFAPDEPQSEAPARGGTTMFARIALVLAGLVAGAVSAAIAMAALHYFGRHESAPPPPPRTTDLDAPGDTTGRDTTRKRSRRATSLRSPGRRIRRRRRSRRRTDRSRRSPDRDRRPERARGGDRAAPRPCVRRGDPAGTGDLLGGAIPGVRIESGVNGTPTATPGPKAPAGTEWPGVSDPLVLAQRALAQGHAEECVEILDDVITHGATPIVLRRRGDCLMRAGRRDGAIRDYQRFCRLVPEHPAVPGLREQLAGMGLTCP